jgi:hypothetical protein
MNTEMCILMSYDDIEEDVIEGKFAKYSYMLSNLDRVVYSSVVGNDISSIELNRQKSKNECIYLHVTITG